MVKIENVAQMSFKIKYGHFEFLMRPVNLRTSPVIIQILMRTIFRERIDDFIVIYLGDIVIFGDNHDDDLEHL